MSIRILTLTTALALFLGLSGAVAPAPALADAEIDFGVPPAASVEHAGDYVLGDAPLDTVKNVPAGGATEQAGQPTS